MSAAPGPFFHGLRFSHAISLGANCETAHQLRRLGRHSIHGLFDWLVTPILAVESILADDGERLARSFISANHGRSVRCGAYGVLYHHEFPREGPGEAFRFDAELIATCRRKLSRKLATVLGACGGAGPVVFIRSGPGTDLGWDDRRTPDDGDIRKLEQAIARRFPDLDFRLLVIDTAPQPQFTPPPSGDRVEIVHAPPRRTEGWALDDEDWDRIAARLRFATPAAAAGPLEETLHLSGEPETVAPPPTPPPREGDDAILARGVALWRDGQAHRAADLLGRRFAEGGRTAAFLEAYAGLLTGEARFGDLLERHAELVREGRTPGRRLDILAAHARLALAQHRDAAIAAAADRERRPAWLPPDALMAALEAACRRRRPFSFVRLGDGEARFALAAGLAAGPGLRSGEAAMLGDVVWWNWFGVLLSEVDPQAVERLARDYRKAVVDADVLGVTDAARLARDTGHYGYLAAQEAWVSEALRLPRRGGRLTSALNHFALDAASPHLARLLGGAPFVGAVSPHPGLAERLAATLSIPRHADYVIPAEGRLPTAEATRLAGPHFPDRYEELLKTLRVPFRGAVFLVAAGLLGKIYCGRIKALGGVALDIGSVADGWMGYDTRPGQMSSVQPLATAPAKYVAPEAPAPTAPSAALVACISMHKTGSTALSDALRESGAGDVLQLHSTSPPQEPFRNGPSPTELAVGNLIRTRPAMIVTCVRDPIAQILSAYFQVSVQRRHLELPEFAPEPDALIAWADRMGAFQHIDSWMDLNLRNTFGFDYRLTPFSRETLSLRYEADGVRLLALRFEDDAALKQGELGWLTGRASVPLPLRNLTSEKSVGRQYLELKSNFAAPHGWLETAYNMEMVRHFYSEADRAAFHRRWSAPAAV